ncbi:ODA1, partial [Symbiodinium sp. KB8]
LILAMLLILPLLSKESADQTPYSVSYGANEVWQAFMAKMGNTSSAAQLATKSYDEALLEYVYYHNWYVANHQGIYCPTANCAGRFLGSLFWIGLAGPRGEVDLSSILQYTQLNATVVAGFESSRILAYNTQDLWMSLGTLPPEVKATLSEPWAESCATSTIDLFGLSLLKSPVSGLNIHQVACPLDLRATEIQAHFTQFIVPRQQSYYLTFYYDMRPFNRQTSAFSLGVTFFVMVLLVTASLMFTSDANRLVLRPVEKMIERIEAIRDKPLLAMKMADDEFKAEEIKKESMMRNKQKPLRRIAMEASRLCASRPEVMETVILEKTIIKLGSLLALGFGEAGADIIGKNMSGSDSAGVNAMVPGRKCECIVGILRVRDFSTATEVVAFSDAAAVAQQLVAALAAARRMGVCALAANLLQERRTDACGTCSDFTRVVASGAGEIAATMDQVVTVAFGDGGTGGLGDMPEEPDAIDEEELVRRCQAAPNPGRFPASPSGGGSPYPLAAPMPSAPPTPGPDSGAAIPADFCLRRVSNRSDGANAAGAMDSSQVLNAMSSQLAAAQTPFLPRLGNGWTNTINSQNQPFYDLAYADDTAPLVGTAISAEQLFHTLQRVDSSSNLHLNLKKCLLLRSPTSHNAITFTDGTPVTIEQHAKYLGVTLSSDGSTNKDITTRLVKARKHFYALHQFWGNTDLTLKWKLRIYNAVFIPLVTYGLESAALTTTSDVLQAKVMMFSNQIAEIVHGVCNEFHGAPNKNTGDSFLVIWKESHDAGLDGTELMQKYAEGAIVSSACVIGAVHHSPLLGSYREHPGLQYRLGSNCRVHLSIGLHKGWAIEGAVGSEFKIDCSYLSPNVSIATSIERSTEAYGVSVMVAQSVVDLCDYPIRSQCRLIDKVIVRGSPAPMELYCIDLDYMSVEVDLTSRPKGIAWNTRQRFKVRQQIEQEKKAVLHKDLAEIFVTDEVILQMRERYTVEFFQLFNMGYQNYSQGEWQVARRMLMHIKSDVAAEDGPSTALLKFMEAPYGFEAPKGWQGIRELARAPGGCTGWAPAAEFVNDIGRRVVCSEEPVACSRGGEGRSHEAPLALLSAEGNGPKWEWLKRFGQSHSVEILGPLQKEPSFAVSRETARKKFCAVRGPPEAPARELRLHKLQTAPLSQKVAVLWKKDGNFKVATGGQTNFICEEAMFKKKKDEDRKPIEQEIAELQRKFRVLVLKQFDLAQQGRTESSSEAELNETRSSSGTQCELLLAAEPLVLIDPGPQDHQENWSWKHMQPSAGETTGDYRNREPENQEEDKGEVKDRAGQLVKHFSNHELNGYDGKEKVLKGEAFFYLLDHARLTKRDKAMVKTKAGLDGDEEAITNAMIYRAAELEGETGFPIEASEPNTTHNGEEMADKEQLTAKTDGEEAEAKKLQDKLDSTQRRIFELREEMAKSGGVNAALDNSKAIAKQIRILENRLDKGLQKFNEAIAANRTLREQQVFDDIYRKLENELQQKKKEMANIIEQANAAYEARDSAQAQMASLKQQADKEHAEFEKEWRELGRLIENDKRMKEFMRTKVRGNQEGESKDEDKHKKKITKHTWDTTKSLVTMTSNQDKVASYEEAFARIQAATGICDIDQLVQNFIDAEDTNFSLFKYNNELSAEIEKLEQQIAEYKEEYITLSGQSSRKEDTEKVASAAARFLHISGQSPLEMTSRSPATPCTPRKPIWLQRCEDACRRSCFPSCFVIDPSAKREDRLVIDTKGGEALWAVFDGHRYPEVAGHASRVLPQLVWDQPTWPSTPELALSNALQQCNELARQEKLCGGSTAVVVATCNGALWCACAGDSRAVVGLKRGGNQRLSTDHTCSLPEEVKRVKMCGGSIALGCLGGVLPMTRGLGNFDLEAEGFACLPQISSVALSEVEFVVVASDGLWDVLSDAECCGLVRSFSSNNVAAELASVARRRGSSDDIAVVGTIIVEKISMNVELRLMRIPVDGCPTASLSDVEKRALLWKRPVAKILENLEEKWNDIDRKAITYEVKHQESQQTLSHIRTCIESIFRRLGCTSEDLPCGCGSGISEANMMVYLAIIEQRTNELLKMYDSLKQEDDEYESTRPARTGQTSTSLQMKLPSTVEDYSDDEDDEDEDDQRPFTRDELKTKANKNYNKKQKKPRKTGAPPDK